MKAILEFNLPEDQEMFDAACKVGDYIAFVNNFANELRDTIKYNPPKNKKEFDILDGIYKRLFELAKEFQVNIW